MAEQWFGGGEQTIKRQAQIPRRRRSKWRNADTELFRDILFFGRSIVSLLQLLCLSCVVVAHQADVPVNFLGFIFSSANFICCSLPPLRLTSHAKRVRLHSENHQHPSRQLLLTAIQMRWSGWFSLCSAVVAPAAAAAAGAAAFDYLACFRFVLSLRRLRLPFFFSFSFVLLFGVVAAAAAVVVVGFAVAVDVCVSNEDSSRYKIETTTPPPSRKAA